MDPVPGLVPDLVPSSKLKALAADRKVLSRTLAIPVPGEAPFPAGSTASEDLQDEQLVYFMVGMTWLVQNRVGRVCAAGWLSRRL